MRKILAFIFTIVTIFALKESFSLFLSTDQTIAGQKPILIVIAISILLPLILFTLWLWKPKVKN